MGWEWLLFIYFGGLIVLFLSGFWVACALGVAGIIGILIESGFGALSSIGYIGWNTSNNFVYTCVPLFIFMGELVMHGGTSTRFYSGINVWIRRLPGGLLHTNIVACSIFAAISGSSAATALSIGTVAIPEMKRRGYKYKCILGSLAAGGTLGILIPPSIIMIIYGAMVEQSIAALFMAGIIPGFLLALLFMVYIIVEAVWHPHLFPGATGADEKPISVVEKIKETSKGWPIYAILVIIFGGLYSGIATPTEVAALGAASAWIVGLIYRELSYKSLVESTKNSIATTCMILFIILSAQIYSFALTNSGVARSLSEWIISLQMSPNLFFMLICVLYIILGSLLDGVSMMVLTLPILYPVIIQMGFDPIWFGVILTILIEMGQITPPFGLNLFALQGISGGRPLSEVILGSLPYCFMIIIMIVILKVFPGLVLFLPSRMG